MKLAKTPGLIITLSGDLGSGKSTFRKAFREFLGDPWKDFYTGGIVRDFAKAEGKDPYVFYEELQNDPEKERAIDKQMVDIMRNESHVIVEGRVASFLAPRERNVVKMFFTVNETAGAKRQLSRPEYAGKSVDYIIARTRERIRTERERYQSLYGIPNHMDRTQFDVILDTTYLSIGKEITLACEKIFSFIAMHLL